MTKFKFTLFFLSLSLLFFQSCDEKDPVKPDVLQLTIARVGTYTLNLTNATANATAPVNQPIVASFSAPLDVNSVSLAIQLKKVSSGDIIPLTFSFLDTDKTLSALPASSLAANEQFELRISNTLKGTQGETFPGTTIGFTTVPDVLQITSLMMNSANVLNISPVVDIPQILSAEINFSHALNPATITTDLVRLSGTSGSVPLIFSLSDGNKKLTLTSSQPLKHLSRHQLFLSNQIKGANGEVFSDVNKIFYTAVDPTPKFPVVSDDELLTLVQQQTFKYFWDYAEPNSGMARERNGSGNLVTSGGSGFGIMSLIVGMERNFINRQDGIERAKKIVSFLETADRFHGAWSHWINGSTGKVIPFSTKDNGGDLVETSFLVQGLLTFRQYLQPTDTVGNNLINRITLLWEGVEWDWYRRGDQNVLYWHWSPNYNWDMNFALSGYFEQQITYLLAAASPTHSIPKIVYTNGFAQNGGIVRNNTYYGIPLKLGGLFPLFWVHYSYLGLDPHFTDDYANYWEQNVNASRINQAYCIANPKNFVGYSDACWGLTSSDNQSGYNAHSPANDLGVITPTAALSSFPYTPNESMKALKYFYYTMGDRLWGQYGFYDAFNITQGWTATSYLAIDQGPIIVMIENHRTGLLWNLFMSAPEVQQGMTKLNFSKN
ncbi:MAG: Ig-like domain-containing protein [Cyclobacteriaceae bacterium]|nr:Ig-like domain-containing protein [Cyclobacteriaceae bacterium]